MTSEWQQDIDSYSYRDKREGGAALRRTAGLHLLS